MAPSGFGCKPHGAGLRDKIKIGVSGKIVTAFDIARAMALGADWCNAARGFMFALGCIQAQNCHTGHCPTGVTTQDPVRQKALVVPAKSDRVYNYHQQTLHALKELVQAAGLNHPAEITASHIVRRHSEQGVKLLANLLPFVQPGALLAGEMPLQVFRTYWPMAQAGSFAIASMRSRPPFEYRPGARPLSPNAALTALSTRPPGPSGFSLLARTMRPDSIAWSVGSTADHSAFSRPRAPIHE